MRALVIFAVVLAIGAGGYFLPGASEERTASLSCDLPGGIESEAALMASDRTCELEVARTTRVSRWFGAVTSADRTGEAIRSPANVLLPRIEAGGTAFPRERLASCLERMRMWSNSSTVRCEEPI